MRLTFTITGPPVPKARARVVSHVDASNKRKTRGITPKRTETYEKHVALCALAARHRFELEWPGYSTTTRFGLLVRVYWFQHEGDWDNYAKAVGDACNGVLWPDDRQIVDGRCTKEKVKRGKERIEVEAWVIEVDSRANMR
jgi:Holliday junction resolvase RusA-like endonuclease